MKVSRLVVPTSVAATAAGLLLLLANPSCSVIEDKFPNQCNTTQDCVDLANRQPRGPDGGPTVSGLVCTDQHVCAPESGCHSNLECQVAHGGAGSAYICRASDRSCQSLGLPSPDGGPDVCKVLADPADYQNENTIWIGAPVLFKDLSYQGLEMVRRDFNSLASGLPPATAGGTARRPLGFVYCDGETIDITGNHLVNDLELPILITSLDTTSEIQLLTNYSIANGKQVFQLSTTAGIDIIKGIDNKGLLVDLAQINENFDKESVNVVKDYYVGALRTAGTLKATELPRIAVVHSSTPTYSNTTTKIVTALKAGNMASAVKDFGYGDSMNPTGTAAEYASVVSTVLAFKPHIIFIIGDNEITSVDAPVEMGWAAAAGGQPPPQWLGLLGAVGQLPSDIATLDPTAQVSWASRTLFFQQHLDFGGQLFTDYMAQLMQDFPGDPTAAGLPPGVGLYEVEQSTPYNEFMREGAYLTAYAISLLAGQGKVLNGPNVSAAVKTFGAQNATSLAIGRANIFPSLQTVAAGNPFNMLTFQQWTGFDSNGFSTYQYTDDVDCLTTTAGGDGGVMIGGLHPTGGLFDFNSGALTGTVSLTGCAGH